MTDPLAPLSDEDLSALLDGQADPSALDRLARDPDARARRDALAAARDAVSEPVIPLSASVVDSLVSRALAAEPDDAVPTDAAHTGAPETPPAPVTPLAPPPPPAGRRTPPAWLVAAAVVALVAVGLGLIWSGSSSTDTSQETAADLPADRDEAGAGSTERSAADDTGTMATESTAEEPNAAVPSQDGETAPTVPSIEDRLGPPVIIGTFADADALRAVVADAFPTGSDAAGQDDLPSDASFQRCAEQMRVQLYLQEPAARYGYAVVDDVATMVYEFDDPVFDDGKPATVLTAVRADTCDPYFTIQR